VSTDPAQERRDYIRAGGAYEQLASVGEFTCTWFIAAMPECAREASFNFTNIGSIFEFLGLARYRGPVFM